MEATALRSAYGAPFLVYGLAGPAGHGKDTTSEILASEVARRAGGSGGLALVGFADALKQLLVHLFACPADPLWADASVKNAPADYDPGALDAALERARGEHFPRLVALFGTEALATRAVVRLDEVFRPEWPVATPRRLLQLFGTEWGRAVRDDVWPMAVRRTAERLTKGELYARRNGFAGFGPEDGGWMAGGAFVPVHGIAIPDVRFFNERVFVRDNLGGHVAWVDATKRLGRNSAIAHKSEPEGPADIGIGPEDVIDNNEGKSALTANIMRWLSSLNVKGVVSAAP